MAEENRNSVDGEFEWVKIGDNQEVSVSRGDVSRALRRASCPCGATCFPTVGPELVRGGTTRARETAARTTTCR